MISMSIKLIKHDCLTRIEHQGTIAQSMFLRGRRAHHAIALLAANVGVHVHLLQLVVEGGGGDVSSLSTHSLLSQAPPSRSTNETGLDYRIF